MKLRFLSLSMALLLSSCSFIDDFDDYNAGPPRTFQEFAPRLLAGLCQKGTRCEAKPGFGGLMGFFCHPEISSTLLVEVFGSVSASIDPEMAQECLDSLASIDCSATGELFYESCDAAILPTVPLGGSCLLDGACLEGRCDEQPLACGSVCVDRADVGEACGSFDEDCDYGLRCRGGTCQLPGSQSDACETTTDCGPELYCSAGSCRPLASLGTACDVNFETAYADPCGGSLVCSAFGSPVNARTCQAGRQAGEACSTSIPCSPGMRCASDNTCHVISEPGGPCLSRDDCQPLFECQLEVCVARPVLGDSCSPTFPCLEGACQGGVCVALPDGSVCNGSNGFLGGQCAGYCANTNLCTPRGSVNAPCEEFVEESCEDGLDCVDLTGAGLYSCQACSP